MPNFTGNVLTQSVSDSTPVNACDRMFHEKPDSEHQQKAKV